MKHVVKLTIPSLLSILLMTFHLADDILRDVWGRGREHGWGARGFNGAIDIVRRLATEK